MLGNCFVLGVEVEFFVGLDVFGNVNFEGIFWVVV